jgi:PKD repeat protein
MTATCHYATAGTYTIRLTITATSGATDTWSTSVVARAPTAPRAVLTVNPSQPYVTLPVTLDASTSTDPDGRPIVGYAFSCGNGTTQNGTATSTTCTYANAGNYSASVKVTDSLGLSSTAKVTVKVLADTAPKAVLTLSSSTVTRGSSITADGSGSTDPDPFPIATYRFDCGNGSNVPTDQPAPTTTCAYPNPGSYTVRLTVTDQLGLSATTTKKVSVK